MACKYILSINGKKVTEVNTEKELEKYIKEHYDVLASYNQFNDIVFDETNSLQSNMKSKILSLNTVVTPSTVFNELTQEYEIKTPKKLAITKAISNWRTPDGSRVVPEFIESEYIKNETKNLMEKEGLSESEANEQVQNNIKNFEHIAKIGDKVHKVAEMFFSENVNSDDIYSVVNLPRETIDNLIRSFESLKDTISGSKHVEFLPEVTVETTDDNSDPLIGRIDLLTVDDRGHVDLYDFKVSTKPIEGWSSAKKINVDYQLAAYRALLANKGIPVSNMGLNIVPIVIPSPNYENETFDSFQIGNVENRLVVNFDNLKFPRGHYSNIVSQHISSSVPRVNIDSDFTYNVGNLSEIAFGKISALTEEQFKRKYVKKEGNKWSFKDYIHGRENKEFPEIVAYSEAELNDKIKAYLAEKEDYDQEGYFVNIWKQFSQLKRSGKNLSSRDPFNFKDSNVHAYLSTVFSSFIDNSAYEMMEDLPELTQLGIYAFVDTGTNIVNFVTMSDVDNKHELDLQYKYNSILANVASSASTKNLKGVMTATAGNAKLLQTLLAINALSDQFANYQIGNIQVVNHKLGQSDYADLTQLRNNFKYLTDRLDIENNFEKGNLQFADPLEAIKTSILGILNKDRTEISKKASDQIYDLYSGVDLNNMTGEHKIKMLRQLQEIIKSNNPNVNFNEEANYGNEAWIVHRKLSQLILHYNNIYFNLDHDIHDIGVNLNNMKETLLINGYLLDNPELVKNPVMKAIVDTTELGLQKIRVEYDKYKEESLQRVLNLYKTKGYTQAGRWTFQNATNAFDNMFIRDSNGKISSEFKVKNPYDPDSTLTDAERKWLKAFLWTINKTRTGITDPNISESEAVKTPEVQRLMESGHYFDIPLLRGTAFSQLKNKSYTKWLKDKWNEAADMRRILGSQEQDIKNQVGDYTHMYNFLNINEARRAELLSEQDTGYWETNLELLEDVFAHASIRKKIFDDLLPFIHDMKNAVNLYAYDGKIPIDDLRKQIDLYIRTVIFNEPGPQGAERLKTLKMVNTFAAVTRSMMLGLNPNSLFREPIQGFYMLASRAANRVMGDNSFTVNDLRKAYSRFMRDGGGPFGDNWSMLEHLNHTYGMTQMDVNGLPYMLYSDRKGVRGLARRLPYWATTAPDFLNRMVFLTAQMYHDGAMDAHSIVNGKLVYDWKKDKRYSEFAKGNKSHPEYNNQKAAYYAHLQQFNKEGYNLKYNESNPEALPMAYTVAEKRNIKSSSDSLFGYMDHENAMAVRHTLMGKLFSQFQMYFSSTRERWLLGGTNQTPKGEWRQKTNENGELLYLKEVIDPETGDVTLEETTEVTPIKAEEWTGRFVEGMVNSMVWLFKYAAKNGFRKNEDYEGFENLTYRLRNARQFMTDIAWQALMLMLLRLIIGSIIEKEGDIDKGTKTVLTQMFSRSTDELNPGAAIAPILFMKSATVEGIQQTYDSLSKLVEGESSFGKEMTRNIAALRTLDNLLPSNE